MSRTMSRKQYRRKLCKEANSLDRERLNNIRKPLNSSERQRGRAEIQQQMQDEEEFWWERHTNYTPDWREDPYQSRVTAYAEFASVFLKLGLLTRNEYWLMLDYQPTYQDIVYTFKL